MTIEELAPIVSDYRREFPTWESLGQEMLVRFEGAVAQTIWFDRLRTGAYRPTCTVRILVAPSKPRGSQGQLLKLAASVPWEAQLRGQMRSQVQLGTEGEGYGGEQGFCTVIGGL